MPLERNNGTFNLATSKFHVSVPFLTTTCGYALLVNHGGAGSVSVDAAGQSSWTLAAQKQLDFWVSTHDAGMPVVGPARTQQLHTHYVDATGHASPLPESATRFWQSRLRYRTTEEAVSVATSTLPFPVFLVSSHIL